MVSVSVVNNTGPVVILCVYLMQKWCVDGDCLKMQINRIFVSHSHIQSARAWRLGVKVCLRSGTYDVLVITSSELLHRGDIATFQDPFSYMFFPGYNTISVHAMDCSSVSTSYSSWVFVATTFCKEQCSFS